MKNVFVAGLAIGALLATVPAASGLAQTAAASPAAAAAASLPGVRHLVYQFGYNTPAATQGTGTGTTTIDLVGIASDGGLTITATDDWWNTVKPRQTYTCEVYANGGVTCAKAPYAISPIQMAIVPLFGQNYFTSLASNSSSNWNQNYDVRATFFPAASNGFAGQVYTWNCAFALTGKGTVPNGAPLILIAANGSMKQKGGRYITANQKANIAYDPRIKMPVLVQTAITFVPQLSTNQYTVELKLIKTGP